MRFLARLDTVQAPILAGHGIDGTPVLPAAAMLAMAAEAGRHWRSGDALCVQDALFESPLPLREPMALQFSLAPDGAAAGWELHATPLARSGDVEAPWTRHATGRLAAASPVQGAGSPPAGVSGDAAAFHAGLAAAGLSLSDAFRGLRRHGRDGEGVVAEIALDEAGPLAPMLRLDAAMQAAALLATDGVLRVPAMVGCAAVAQLPAAFRLRARRQPAEGDDILADLDLWSMEGAPLGRMCGVRLRRRGAADPLAGLAWTLAWQDAPGRPAPDAVAAAQAEGFAARLDGLRDHAVLLASLDRRAAAHAGAALAALGLPGVPGAEVPDAAALGIAPRHHALFARMLAMLEEDGALHRDTEGGLRVVALPHAPADATPPGPEAALLDRCGAALPAVLRGAADPLDLLFADGAAGRVHRESLWSTPLSAQLAEAAAALLAGHDAPRVIEIGGGTGGTTAALLPRLPDTARYLFTDVAAALLAEAAQRFGHARFATRLLDIERAPAAQGFGAERFDLVVAANVLHATRDLRATLRHVRGLVADGGTLALVECTASPRWGELTFGLTEGWWRFGDAALRSAPPMLDPAAWRALLHEAGFEAVGVLDAGATPWRQAVILTRAAPAQGQWLVIGGQTARGLAQQLRDGGASVTALPMQADAAAALAAMPGPLAGVVLACPTEDLPDHPLEAQDAICLPALRLVRALVADGRAAPVWLVTRGAVETGGDGPPCPAQAALWGFGRTLRLEHPELTPRLIDLDGEADAAALAAAIRAPDAEAQLALRGGRRRVARLRPEVTPPALPALPGPDGALDDDAVEIAVQATGVNFRDVLIGLGAYPESTALPGVEALGTVTAVGSSVAGVAPGDTVLAIAPGAFGARIRATASLCVPVDPSGSDDRAGLPVAYLTAAWTLRALAGLAPGQRVLVHAAAGGTGLAALHVARLAGAQVVAAASRGKHAFLRGLGVSRILDSRDAAAWAGCGPVDVVLSSLGAAAGRAALAALVPGGCFLELGRGDALDAAEAARLRPDIRFHAIDLAREMREAPDRLAPVLRDVLAEVAQGALPPLPVTRIGAAATALKRLQAARHPGKLVVTRRLTEGAVLLTGAFGGLGLLLARVLVARGVRHLVLAGRHPPTPAQHDAIEALRAAGASVRSVMLDVTDAAAVARLLDEVDAGAVPLRGIVHAVGVVEDAPVAMLDAAAFERVMAPKLAGAWTLHALTRDRRLDLFVLCSSAAGTLGNAGQAAHAAANAALDALAQRRRTMGLPGMSIAWGPWASIGTAVTAAVARHLAARGMPGLAPDAGVAAFDAVLGSGLASPVVMRIDTAGLRAARGHDPLLAALPQKDPAVPPQEETPVRAVPGEAPAAAPTRAAIEAAVRGALAAVLGLAGPGAADPRRLFFDQGMDSLTSLEFRNRLQAALGRPVAAGIALDHPTIERLVAHLAGEDAAPDMDAMDDEQLGALLDARLDGVFGA